VSAELRRSRSAPGYRRLGGADREADRRRLGPVGTTPRGLQPIDGVCRAIIADAELCDRHDAAVIDKRTLNWIGESL
jgi:hypothetical protein